MKKITILFSILIASISAFAATTLQITMSSANQGDKVLQIVVDNPFSNADDNGYDAVVGAGQQGGLYVVYNSDRYTKYYTNELGNNLPLGFGAVEDSEYTFNFSYFTGTSFTIYDKKLDKTITVADNILVDGVAADPANKYTFSIEDEEKNTAINDRFIINPDYVFMKGDFDAPNAGNEWIYTDDFTKNGATASLEMSLVADAWYHFQIVVNGATGANGSAFDKDNKSYVVPTTGFGTQMTLHTDVAGTYTFTWTYATNTLEIGFPTAPAPVYAAEVTTNAKGLATFSYDSDLQAVENDVKLYKGDLNGNELVLSGVNYVKANEGVIVYGAANTTYHFNNVGTGTSDFTGNELLPASAWQYPHDGKDIYVLSGNMLYLYEGDQMKPNKAFLKVQNPISGNAPARISMRFNGTQDVENAEAEDAKAVKFVENGEIFIRRGNEVYNLQGQIVK